MGNKTNKSDFAFDESPKLCVVDLPEIPSANAAEKTSSVPGVSWRRWRNKWCVYLTIEGRGQHIGYFNNQKEAEVVAIKTRELNPKMNKTNIVANTRFRQGGTSKYRGVCWDKNAAKWVSAIGYKQKSKHLGYFLSEKEAALAYDKAALQLFGEYARTNQMIYPEDFK